MLDFRRKKNEFIIKIPSDLIEESDIIRFLDYLEFRQSIKKSQMTSEQAIELSEEIKKNWWKENEGRVLKRINNQ